MNALDILPINANRKIAMTNQIENVDVYLQSDFLDLFIFAQGPWPDERPNAESWERKKTDGYHRVDFRLEDIEFYQWRPQVLQYYIFP